MSLRSNALFKIVIRNYINSSKYSTETVVRTKQKIGHCLITTKRKKFDHYTSTHYNNLDEIPLVSKGWNHSKSKGDFFTINPYVEEAEITVPFHKLDISNSLVKTLRVENIKEATAFQAEAIPVVHSGKHTLLAAETGCGKTIAYLLPIINRLRGQENRDLNTPLAVILTPNRELAYQIGEVATKLCESENLSVKIVTGGRTKTYMMNPVFEKIDILVATPGALGKLSTVGIYKLNKVQHSVLDEADTLIDDSFIDRITGLLNRLSQSQIILVSATLPRRLPDVLLPLEKILQQVISPKIHKPLVHVHQKFFRLTKSDKPSNLLQLTKNTKSPMIVFSNRSETCNWLAMFLRENDVPCSNINGDMNYNIRIEQWNQFIEGKTNILSCTDVASRGLNTIYVNHVLNYDFPLYAADYLHRVGRVGRLGSSDQCKITNFVASPREIQLVQQIELAIRKNQPLNNVDGNITKIVQNKIIKSMRDVV